MLLRDVHQYVLFVLVGHFSVARGHYVFGFVTLRVRKHRGIYDM